MSELLTHTGTIAAIATAVVPQQGSVGIVRVSGDQALAIAKTLFLAPGKQAWESHRILYGFIRQPQTKQVIDEALLLIMKAPRSFTREDVVEFHCHGGIMAVQQVLQLCLDLVGAKSPQAAQTALAGLRGKLAQPIRNLRSQCLDILAEIEARIDFEEDLPPLDEQRIINKIDRISLEINKLLATKDQGELLRTGLKVAIVGRPNVGKSSLLNAWSQSDRAIVTDLPGTTRDVVESQLVVKGIPIQVLDTAGIRATSDTVEKIGVERSLNLVQKADLILFTINYEEGWTKEDTEIYEKIKDRPLILVINKCDLQPSKLLENIPKIKHQVNTAVALNQGIEELENAILKAIKAQEITALDVDFAINQRQKGALIRAKTALMQVQETINNQLPLDFWTIDLRSAISIFGEITGEEITESVLDRIFSRFCIGK